MNDDILNLSWELCKNISSKNKEDFLKNLDILNECIKNNKVDSSFDWNKFYIEVLSSDDYFYLAETNKRKYIPFETEPYFKCSDGSIYPFFIFNANLEFHPNLDLNKNLDTIFKENKNLREFCLNKQIQINNIKILYNMLDNTFYNETKFNQNECSKLVNYLIYINYKNKYIFDILIKKRDLINIDNFINILVNYNESDYPELFLEFSAILLFRKYENNNKLLFNCLEKIIMKAQKNDYKDEFLPKLLNNIILNFKENDQFLVFKFLEDNDIFDLFKDIFWLKKNAMNKTYFYKYFKKIYNNLNEPDFKKFLELNCNIPKSSNEQQNYVESCKVKFTRVKFQNTNKYNFNIDNILNELCY